MRFIDYNNSGRLDLHDIATSIGVENAERGERTDYETQPKGPEANAGCATTAALIALPLLIILLAL